MATSSPYNINSYIADKSNIIIAGSGYINDTFPNQARCTYSIGPLNWKVEYGGVAYKYTNSTAFNVNMTTYPLQVSILVPNNQTFRRGTDLIPYIANVSDDCSGVTNATIAFEALPTASWTICSGEDVTDNYNGTYNCSVVSSSAAEFSKYNLTMNATKQYYSSSLTTAKNESFWIVTWGATWTYSATVTNPDTSVYKFDNVNVSLWLNRTGIWELANSTLCL